LEPPRVAVAEDGGSRCGAAVARVRAGVVVLDAAPVGGAEQFDALRAVLPLLWQAADQGQVLDWSAVRATLDLIP
jgi:hypothetical protein